MHKTALTEAQEFVRLEREANEGEATEWILSRSLDYLDASDQPGFWALIDAIPVNELGIEGCVAVLGTTYRTAYPRLNELVQSVMDRLTEIAPTHSVSILRSFPTS